MTTLPQRRARVLATLALLLLSLSLTGCLTAEKKEYFLKMNPDGSGSGRIVFHNIMSAQEDSSDVTMRDYTDLVNQYVKGTKFEDGHPGFTNVKKRLYENDGVLNGEVTFDFSSPELVGLYRYKDKGTWVYYMGYDGGNGDMSVEHYDSSTGELAGDKVPLIFWPEGTTEFEIRTKLGEADRSSRSLLALFRRIGSN